MGAPEGEGGGGGDESSSISYMKTHPSAWQYYFEMKTNKDFSILSSIILWSTHKLYNMSWVDLVLQTLAKFAFVSFLTWVKLGL